MCGCRNAHELFLDLLLEAQLRFVSECLDVHPYEHYQSFATHVVKERPKLFHRSPHIIAVDHSSDAFLFFRSANDEIH